MIDTTTTPDSDFTMRLLMELSKSNFRAERLNCNTCNWEHPDTCKACRADQRSVVMAVNSDGIKREVKSS